jgi:hypothetical protein
MIAVDAVAKGLDLVRMGTGTSRKALLDVYGRTLLLRHPIRPAERNVVRGLRLHVVGDIEEIQSEALSLR